MKLPLLAGCICLSLLCCACTGRDNEKAKEEAEAKARAAAARREMATLPKVFESDHNSTGNALRRIDEVMKRSDKKEVREKPKK